MNQSQSSIRNDPLHVIVSKSTCDSFRATFKFVLSDVLVCKKMAPFTMNASNIERFAALTTQMRKDLFEVKKNLTERWFWALRRLEKKQDKRVLSAHDGMLLVV